MRQNRDALGAAIATWRFAFLFAFLHVCNPPFPLVGSNFLAKLHALVGAASDRFCKRHVARNSRLFVLLQGSFACVTECDSPARGHTVGIVMLATRKEAIRYHSGLDLSAFLGSRLHDTADILGHRLSRCHIGFVTQRLNA